MGIYQPLPSLSETSLDRAGPRDAKRLYQLVLDAEKDAESTAWNVMYARIVGFTMLERPGPGSCVFDEVAASPSSQGIYSLGELYLVNLIRPGCECHVPPLTRV